MEEDEVLQVSAEVRSWLAPRHQAYGVHKARPLRRLMMVTLVLARALLEAGAARRAAKRRRP